MTNEEIAAFLFEDLGEADRRNLAGRRLVHYTSAKAAAQIISTRQVWLRNALLMNDFSEIQYGLDCLNASWRSEVGNRFRIWLDAAFPDLRPELEISFGQDTPGLRQATFLMSLSQHNDEEDELGRLSMWRAYGGKCGVAMVLNSQIFSTETDALGVYSAPVRYLSPEQFTSWFERWTASIIEKEEALRAADPGMLLSRFRIAFRQIVLCTKHRGFAEEREWRVFHSPLQDRTSDWLTKENKIVDSLPQEIMTVSLRDDAEQGVHGLEPRTLVDRIIIGPTAHPLPVYHSLYNLLVEAGIADVAQRICISNIPLRD